MTDPLQQQYAPPSRNPADDGTLVGVLRLVLTKFLQGVDDMLPAQVIAYDRASNRASIQPLIAVVTTAGIQITRGQVASVPVLQLGGGGFVLSFPISSGDLGWIKANDRDISLFKKTYANSPPNTQRKHSFEDALFIPDTMLQQVTIAGEDAAAAVLQSKSGAVRISMFDDHIKITSPNMTIDTTLLTVTGDVEIGGISFLTHVHGGVMPGGGNTGVPHS